MGAAGSRRVRPAAGAPDPARTPPPGGYRSEHADARAADAQGRARDLGGVPGLHRGRDRDLLEHLREGSRRDRWPLAPVRPRPFVVETYPRYVIPRLWPKLKIPSKRKEPARYVEVLSRLLRGRGYRWDEGFPL